MCEVVCSCCNNVTLQDVASQFWMDLLNDLRERNLFNNSHEHTCLLRFVFMDVLQSDLDECREKWNTHTIRPVKQSRCPSGKPEVMYNLVSKSSAVQMYSVIFCNTVYYVYDCICLYKFYELNSQRMLFVLPSRTFRHNKCVVRPTSGVVELTCHVDFCSASPDINKRRAAFSESKKKLHAAKIQFALYYPATLQFTHNGRRMKFTDPATALTYVNKNVAADDGSSVSQVTEDAAGSTECNVRLGHCIKLQGGYERPLDPNLEKLYRIYLTVPISSAQAERTFSRRKLIKSYLRSTMSESRLSNLALLFIEREISEKANFNNVVETFARMKNRKTQF
ncbi:uncharacterized protein LOC110155161 [Scomber scombrus]|uniref:Uncharacterized protein LOC110155161 n=1 Tax=Scomber scombrus TaxID=13677 RepID=A0AAV1PYP4_SCOSC